MRDKRTNLIKWPTVNYSESPPGCYTLFMMMTRRRDVYTSRSEVYLWSAVLHLRHVVAILRDSSHGNLAVGIKAPGFGG